MKKFLQKLLFGIIDKEEVSSASSHFKKTTYNPNNKDYRERIQEVFLEKKEKIMEFYNNLN